VKERTPPQPRPRATDVSRFDNLVELVGSVNRCADCGKRGFLVEVGVQSEPVHRKRRYFAEWNHPDRDGETTSIHEFWWP
jgi:hypothetical protein